jgi:hypothetical protein
VRSKALLSVLLQPPPAQAQVDSLSLSCRQHHDDEMKWTKHALHSTSLVRVMPLAQHLFFFISVSMASSTGVLPCCSNFRRRCSMFSYECAARFEPQVMRPAKPPLCLMRQQPSAQVVCHAV